MDDSFATRMLEWARESGRIFSWRSDKDPFRVLLAEVLLQRSRATTVDRVLQELIAKWPTPHAVASADLQQLAEVLRPLGLTSRATRIQGLAKALAEREDVPTSPLQLRELPGVGYYAASSTSAAMGGEEQPLVDSVSSRVFRRYFDAGEYQDVIELAARVYSDAPAGRWHELNWAVLDLASAICRPKRPLCNECPVTATCGWAEKNTRATLS